MKCNYFTVKKIIRKKRMEVNLSMEQYENYVYKCVNYGLRTINMQTIKSLSHKVLRVVSDELSFLQFRYFQNGRLIDISMPKLGEMVEKLLVNNGVQFFYKTASKL